MCEACTPHCDYSCVKIAPQGTVIVRGYDDFVPLKPTMKRKVDHITWTIRFKNGSARRFSFRTGGKDGR